MAVAVPRPDRPATDLCVVSYVGRERSSTGQEVVTMIGPGEFEPKRLEANVLETSNARRRRVASLPAIGTPRPLECAPFLPAGMEGRYLWYQRTCPTSRSECVLGTRQSEGMADERPDPLELGTTHTTVVAAASAAAKTLAALEAAARHARIEVLLARQGNDLMHAREEAILNLVAQVRLMEPQFHALLPPPPTRAAAATQPYVRGGGAARRAVPVIGLLNRVVPTLR